MKKIIIIMLIVLMNSGIAFAYVTDNPVNYGANPLNYGNQANNYFLYTKKGNKILTTDVRDLQEQVNKISRMNYQLQFKIQKMERENKMASVKAAPVNNVIQNNKIEKIEKRINILESAIKGIRSVIDKTLNLLTELLSLIK